MAAMLANAAVCIAKSFTSFFLGKNFTEHAIVDAVELKDPLLDDPGPAAMRRGAYASLQFRSRQSAPPNISAVRTMPERRATIEGGITSPERRQC